MGAEVLMSAHVGVELSGAGGISGTGNQSRGADIVKIIVGCQSKEQQIQILHTNLDLNNKLNASFLYTCGGNQYSRFIRFNAPIFGSMLAFGHCEYSTYPTVKSRPLKSLLRFMIVLAIKLEDKAALILGHPYPALFSLKPP